jgi:hypothetical protein
MSLKWQKLFNLKFFEQRWVCFVKTNSGDSADKVDVRIFCDGQFYGKSNYFLVYEISSGQFLINNDFSELELRPFLKKDLEDMFFQKIMPLDLNVSSL